MKFIKTEKVNRLTLVRDWDFYPRHDIDSTHVGDLVEAMKSGSKIPPLEADIKTKKLLDGWHRDKGYDKLKIDEVEVNFYEFEDDKEMLWWAIHWNAQHGMLLSQHDRTRCLNFGREKGLTDIEISRALVISVDRIQKMEIQRVRFLGPTRTPVEVKRVLSDITKDTVTQEQFTAQKPFNAMRADYSIERSIDALRGNLLPVDVNNISRVRKLQTACEEWLAKNDLKDVSGQ